VSLIRRLISDGGAWKAWAELRELAQAKAWMMTIVRNECMRAFSRNDADTQSEVTQYFFDVPAQYLDVALRVEADRARHLTLSQSGWQAESGAIKQEVTQDDSVAIQKLFLRTILPSIFKGTPYASDVLGTQYGFNHLINASVLRKFYSTWYHPNNDVYVVAVALDQGALPAPVLVDRVRTPRAEIVAGHGLDLTPLAHRRPAPHDAGRGTERSTALRVARGRKSASCDVERPRPAPRGASLPPSSHAGR